MRTLWLASRTVPCLCVCFFNKKVLKGKYLIPLSHGLRGCSRKVPRRWQPLWGYHHPRLRVIETLPQNPVTKRRQNPSLGEPPGCFSLRPIQPRGEVGCPLAWAYILQIKAIAEVWYLHSKFTAPGHYYSHVFFVSVFIFFLVIGQRK